MTSFKIFLVLFFLNLSAQAQNIALVIYKSPPILQVWQKSKGELVMTKEYPVCRMGYYFGPKRRQGDMATPEGVYFINRFNPYSLFHLSMGINYPNSIDKAREVKGARLGGDIFIHGNCVSAGCIAMTDSIITILFNQLKPFKKESIPVIILPTNALNEYDEILRECTKEKDPDLIYFNHFKDMKMIFEYWNLFHKVPKVKGNSYSMVY